MAQLPLQLVMGCTVLLWRLAQVALSVAQLEAQVSRLAELLANVISDTRGRVEKKQAQVVAVVAREGAPAHHQPI